MKLDFEYTDKAVVTDTIATLWGGITDTQKASLLNAVSICGYKKGEFIYHDGENPTNMMLVVSGKAKIYKDCDGNEDRRQILRIIKPNEFFAYRAFFAGECYKTMSIALEPTTIAKIPLPLVKEMSLANKNVAAFLIYNLAKVLGHSDERIVNLTQKHIRGRLAETLLELKNEYGGDSICLHMSRADLACLSNMTTSNAIRTLSAFASEGLVEIDRRSVRILNETELANISKMG